MTHALVGALGQALGVEGVAERVAALRGVASAAQAASSDATALRVALQAATEADLIAVQLLPPGRARVAAYDDFLLRVPVDESSIESSRFRASLWRAAEAGEEDSIEQLCQRALAEWHATGGVANARDLDEVLLAEVDFVARRRKPEPSDADFLAALREVVDGLGALDRNSERDKQSSVAWALYSLAVKSRARSTSLREGICDLLIETFAESGWNAVLALVVDAFLELGEVQFEEGDANGLVRTLDRFVAFRAAHPRHSESALVHLTRLKAAVSPDDGTAVGLVDDLVQRYGASRSSTIAAELSLAFELKARLLERLEPQGT